MEILLGWLVPCIWVYLLVCKMILVMLFSFDLVWIGVFVYLTSGLLLGVLCLMLCFGFGFVTWAFGCIILIL